MDTWVDVCELTYDYVMTDRATDIDMRVLSDLDVCGDDGAWCEHSPFSKSDVRSSHGRRNDGRESQPVFCTICSQLLPDAGRSHRACYLSIAILLSHTLKRKNRHTV